MKALRRYLGMKNNVIFAIPFEWDKLCEEQYLTSWSLKLYSRNAQCCSGLTGRTSGLPFVISDDLRIVRGLSFCKPSQGDLLRLRLQN
jgi:hypothetical protein